MEIWVGDIASDVEDLRRIPDVHIHASYDFASSGLLPRDCKLRILDVVYVSDIPLHLFAGPGLVVSSDDTVTQDYFSSVLLDGDRESSQEENSSLPWWRRQAQQSDYGILLKVDQTPQNMATGVTEILIYAALDMHFNVRPGIITPPRSSSPDFGLPSPAETSPSQNKLSLKLYALPLDSRRLSLVNYAKEPIVEELTPLDDGEARFLDHVTAKNNTENESLPQKRRKLSTVFDDATQQRRKCKGRGGESISRAMAEGPLWQPGRSTDNASQLSKTEISQLPHDALPVDVPRRGLSRASSVGSLPNLGSSRPLSRRGIFVAGKRSSLNRVESVVSNSDGPFNEESNKFEQQNKSTLARIVMAGMRMYGLQQQKKASKSQPPLEPYSGENAGEDPGDYKSIYHQTFKAAFFTFRTHFSTRLVAQEPMREVVDRLLSLFCLDPLPCPSTTKLSTGMFGSQEESIEDVFDRPSSNLLGMAAIRAPHKEAFNLKDISTLEG